MQHTQAYSGGAVCRGCRKSFLRGRIFEIDLWSPPLFDGFRGILPKAAPKSQIGARSELIASSPVLRCVLNFDHVCGKRRLRQERLPHGALHWTFRIISDILTTPPSSRGYAYHACASLDMISESPMPFLENGSESSSLSEADGTAQDAFQKLVADLSAVLGPSSGLDSDDVDPVDIQRLMEKYVSNEQEWTMYAMGDASRTYTRNLVDEGNGKSNLETLYAWPEEDKVKEGQSSPLHITKQTKYGENQVTYMSDKLGLHKISNPDPSNFAISLHLYTPPNAATYGFSLFDEKTGKAKHIKQCDFYSRHGRKV
ncbi:hypothetical protein DTO063F5_3709 [Paecilomyces variotii]|nr:hypothetical protein DTO063F5_3709 [Paecilomyces variotii]